MSLVRSMLNVWRTLCFFGMYWTSIVFMFVTCPVLLLNNPLRKLGVPERWLPGLAQVRFWGRLIVTMGGIYVDTHYLEKSKEHLASGAIYMFNHTSNLDPVLVSGYCPEMPRMIYKKSLNYVPLMGQVFQLYGHVPIDRGNREKAIDSCNKLVKRVIRKHQYVGVSPEGTRSKSGELLEFKRGPFHMAQQANAPIIPVIIEGAWDLLPPGRVVLRSGSVDFTLMAPIFPKEDETIDALSARVRGTMAQQLLVGKKKRAAKLKKLRSSSLLYRVWPFIGPTVFTVVSWVLFETFWMV